MLRIFLDSYFKVISIHLFIYFLLRVSGTFSNTRSQTQLSQINYSLVHSKSTYVPEVELKYCIGSQLNYCTGSQTQPPFKTGIILLQ